MANKNKDGFIERIYSLLEGRLVLWDKLCLLRLPRSNMPPVSVWHELKVLVRTLLSVKLVAGFLTIVLRYMVELCRKIM